MTSVLFIAQKRKCAQNQARIPSDDRSTIAAIYLKFVAEIAVDCCELRVGQI